LTTNEAQDDWIKMFKEFIKIQEQGGVESDVNIARKVAKFVMIGDDLYKRGQSTPLLKCLSQEQAEYILRELHEGMCVLHCGAQTMAKKVLHASYYWLTVREYCSTFVRSCRSVKNLEISIICHLKSFKVSFHHGHLQNGKWIFYVHFLLDEVKLNF